MLRQVYRAIRQRTTGLRDRLRQLGGTGHVQRSVPLLPGDRVGKRRRWHVLVDLVHEELEPGALRIGEIGVASGSTALHLLRYCPQIEELVGVDLRPPVVEFGAEASRFRFLEGYSDEMSRHVDDASLDLVFIDADHSEEWVERDVRAWLPKVKAGGILSGHDYGSHNYPGVKRAVDRLVPGPIRLEANKVWWTRLPPAGA